MVGFTELDKRFEMLNIIHVKIMSMIRLGEIIINTPYSYDSVGTNSDTIMEG